MNLRDIIPEKYLSNTLDKSTKEDAALVESTAHVIMEAELTKDQIEKLFISIEQIINRPVTEGVWDSIKNVAGKTAGAVSKTMKNITTAVTADKLMKLWAKNGSPTNNNDIAKLLYNNKIPIEVIKQSFNSTKIPLPFKSKDVKSADPKNSEASADTDNATPAASAGSNAFSQMAGQLGNTSTTSTGGQVTKTPTGIKHTSAANLPIKKLEKDWIEYLKSSQIVQLKSDPETGKLAYKRPVKLDDVKHFLSSEGYEDEQIETALSFVNLTGKPAPTSAPVPVSGPATTAPATTPAPTSASVPKRRGGRQPGAAPSQTPDAIRKREARQKKKMGVAEDIADTSSEVSEQDVEKIFAELLKSKPVSENTKHLDRILQLAGIYKPVNNSF